MSSIALKFTSLVIRTLSKPIANVIKNQAKQHASFRKICIAFAQGLHQTDFSLRLRLLGERNAKVRPLNDAKAIDSGANFLSETFIFSVAGGLIFYESYRSRRKELQRQESVADDIKTLQDEIEQLKINLKEQNIRINEYHVPSTMKPAILRVEKQTNKPEIIKSEPATVTNKKSAAGLDNIHEATKS